MNFKVKKNVTLPLLKIKPNGAPAFVRFENPMFIGKKLATGSDADKKKEAATLAHIVNLETGEEMQIICPFLLREHLNTEYPKDGYVGKEFRIVLTRDPEKKYNHVGIQEIEWDHDDTKAPGPATFEEPDHPVAGATAGEVAASKRKPAKKK